MSRPRGLWLLLLALVILGAGGIYGGVAMLRDPSGAALGMDSVLTSFPVRDYFLPGTFLLVVMGAVPFALAHGLLTRPGYKWSAGVRRITGHHGSWLGTLALMAVLTVWLAAQAYWIGFRWPVQWAVAGLGALIVVLALLPSVRRYLRVR